MYLSSFLKNKEDDEGMPSIILPGHNAWQEDLRGPGPVRQSTSLYRQTTHLRQLLCRSE